MKMKSLMRWFSVVGLVGSTTLGSLLISSLQAFALPVEQIVQRLQTVPVFTIADANGAPLVAREEGQQGNVAGVFFNPEDAKNFVESLKQSNPQLASQVQVLPVSLGDIYKLEHQSGNQPDALKFAFVPTQAQMELAQQIWTGQRQGDAPNEFQGVPLFVAKAGPDQGYLTLQRENQQLIPFFFEKAQLQALVDRFKEQQPNLANSINIEVVPLEGVIATFEESNNEQLNQILLIPSQAALTFVQQNQPANRSNATPPRSNATPTASPNSPANRSNATPPRSNTTPAPARPNSN